jgi:hypothetical protein
VKCVPGASGIEIICLCQRKDGMLDCGSGALFGSGEIADEVALSEWCALKTTGSFVYSLMLLFVSLFGIVSN